MASITLYATNDGNIQGPEDASWSNARGASSGTVDTTGIYCWARLFGGTYSVTRGFLQFDTSSLGAGAVITSATLSIYGQASGGSQAQTYNIYSGTQSSSLTGTDFPNVGSSAFCDTPITQAGWSTAGYNNFSFNATGLSAINKTGTTKFSLREVTDDVSNSAPGVSDNTYIRGYNSTASGTSQDPILVINYSLPTSSMLNFFFS